MTAFATVFVAPNIATAQVVRATLEAEGIACELPDEHMASLGWHLGNVIAGIRVQVDQADLERAEEVLATLETGPGDYGAEASSAAADRAAMRAWRLSILGFGLWPFFHPYALKLGLRALKAPELSSEGRTRARSAVRISAVSLAALLGVIAALAAW